MNVIFSIKIGGYYSFQICPIEYKNLKLQYKDIPKTLDELFDFSINIYQYYFLFYHIHLNINKVYLYIDY